jgi:glucoamylase
MKLTATPLLQYSRLQASAQLSDLSAVAQHMFSLMLRNVASDGFVFIDPLNTGKFSTPGCVIASPSYPADLGTVDQDYVFNWTRDAAIAAIELAFSLMPTRPGESPESLIDYVNFANICQNSGAPTIGHACFTIEGRPRQWTEQSDGPSLQTLAILQAWSQLDSPTQATARTVIAKNLAYLLSVYQSPTTNLWEEKNGNSFFARAVQLRCFQEISSNMYGIPVPAATAGAISWLQTALKSHWNGTYYVSIMPQSAGGQGYDPNIDIVLASIYGAIPCTDTQLLATGAQLRSQWADSTSSSYYPINGTDQAQSLGPMMGRYPADTYDGDMATPVPGGHPWALCTCNFAELYYRLANAISSSKTIPFDNLSSPFFAQVGVTASTTWDKAVMALQNAGDTMLRAVIFHSDHLELSEQFDGTSGFEKSVSDLTWSYAAFLSAVRSKTGSAVGG